MFRVSHWKIYILIVSMSLVAACAPTESQIAPPIVAFEFTPVPTATPLAGSVVEAESGDFSGQFSISVDTSDETVAVEQSVVVAVNSAEPSPSPILVQATPPTVAAASPAPAQFSMPNTIANRVTLEHAISNSRLATSNLAYTINVANGIGSLSCLDANRYYEAILVFDRYKAEQHLQIAAETYVRALDTAVIGLSPLYEFCTAYLGESEYHDEIAIREIEPATIWDTAVAESNASLNLAEDAEGWLVGSADLLTGVYHQLQNDLAEYQFILTDPTIDACAPIRSTYERIAQNTITVDFGVHTEFLSSYNSYHDSVRSIARTGQALYEFCDPATGGMAQLIENSITLLPSELTEEAHRGLVHAQYQVELAHFYATPATPVPQANN